MTYGSLGAMIVLLTWFRIIALMLLVEAEINCQIEAGAAQERLPGHLTPAPSVKPAA